MQMARPRPTESESGFGQELQVICRFIQILEALLDIRLDQTPLRFCLWLSMVKYFNLNMGHKTSMNKYMDIIGQCIWQKRLSLRSYRKTTNNYPSDSIVKQKVRFSLN